MNDNNDVNNKKLFASRIIEISLSTKFHVKNIWENNVKKKIILFLRI